MNRKFSLSLLFVAIVLAFALPATAQVYKWVDEKGRTHYGEKPPEGVKAVEMGAPPPSPGGNTAPAAQPDWKQKELESKRQRIEREKKESQDSARAERRESERAYRCEDGRRRLAMLDEQIRLYDRNEKGEKVYMEDKDRPAALATARRLVAENC
jgi:Domain of unknown function (DUF4124)